MRSPRLFAVLLLAACGDDSGSSSADAAPMIDARVPAGFISFSWTIQDEDGPTTCAEVGNPTVRITALPEAGGVAEIDTFACSSMTGTTLVPVGSYSVTVNLGSLDENDAITGVTVQDGQDTPIGLITFEVAADGAIRFRVDVAGASASNCDPEGSDGGGITDFILELRDSTGTTCISHTFDVGGESYASDCAGAKFRCIDNDEDITISGLVAGAYLVRIQGFEGPNICYPYDAAMNAPAGGTVNDEGTIPLVVVDPAPDAGAALCMNP
jgi:hypothetical protein